MNISTSHFSDVSIAL